jgi:hypothetical protein
MERTDILALMGELKLYGMRTAYDEVMAAGIKRQHEPPHIVGDLLKAEIAEKGTIGNSVCGPVSSSYKFKAVLEENSELSFGHHPFPWRHLPLFLGQVQHQEQ